jgi:hypothetical protein
MAWRIHSWDATTCTGTVVSSHFGPWPFESPESEFVVGEDVLVELVGKPGSYGVTNVRHSRQRQPEGTSHPVLEELNAHRYEDCHVEAQTDDSLTLWLGDCCPFCCASLLVTFRDIKSIVGLSKHGDLDSPLFRLASVDERAQHALALADNAAAYCIVTNHGYGPDGPCVFIVAGAIDIAPYTAPAG